MSFDIPDWGGGDCFSYYTDLPPLVPASSENSGNELTKVKKRLKRKGDQDCEDFHAIPKKRKTDVTNSSIKQNNANQTQPSSSPTRSPEKKKNKKKKEKIIHQTADNKGTELKSEGTSNTVTSGTLHRSPEHVNGVLLPKTSQKKKKKKNNNKYKELNTEQKKGKTPQGNVLSGTWDAFDESISCDISANANMNCELNSEILVATTAVLQQKVNESMAGDKEKNQKKKRKRVKLKSIQASSLEKCGIQSENALEQHKVTDTEKGIRLLSSEINMNTKKANGKQSKKSKKVVNKIGAENAMNSENMKNENVYKKENHLDKSKSKVMKEMVEKGKKSVEVKNEKQNKQLKDKKQKKGKRNNESTEELLFDAENEEDFDPRFQSDFKALLKELDFERFHSSKSRKDENMNTNESGITSALDSELDNNKDPVEVEDENEDLVKSLRDSDIEEESGPLHAKIKDDKEILETVEDLEDDGKEYNEDREMDGNTEVNPQTENCKDSLEYEEIQIHKAVTKKMKGKKVKKKIEVKIDTCEKSSIKNNETGKKFDKDKLARVLDEANTEKQLKQPALSSVEALKQKMINQLAVARFRMVNEELYTSSSTDSRKVFKNNPEAFTVYHTGYQAQVRRWPVNPLDLIVSWLSKKSTEWVVADFGCGEAALSLRVPQKKVYSLDLVAANSRVTACDMAHSPLASASVDVVVFCLSLMSSNIKDFIVEANRVLREGGIMKIAEVESRFGDVEQFVNLLGKFGFHCNHKDTSRTYFFLFEFKKNRKLKKTTGMPDINLKPCIYKKR